MWKQRLHKGFHRVLGGTLALVALLQEVKTIDLTPFFSKPSDAVAVISVVSLVIVGLEFLPILGRFLDGDDKDAK